MPKVIQLRLPQGDFTLKLRPTEYKIEYGSDMSMILRIASDSVSITEDFTEYESDISIEEFLGICKEGETDE